MNPVFFPRTWICEPVRVALFACFKQIAVYQVDRELIPESLRRLEAENRLEILLSEEEKEGRLPDLLKDYRAWADLHRGERPDFLKFSPASVPFSRETSISRIRSEIREAEKKERGALFGQKDIENDLLLNARLFLAVAQEYDRQQESVSMDLRQISAMEKSFFQNLMPEPDPVKPEAGKLGGWEAGKLKAFSEDTQFFVDVSDKGSMPAERLAAWSRLHAHHRRTTPDGEAEARLFVTGDQEIFELLASDNTEVVCRVTGIPMSGEVQPSGSSAIQEKIQKALREAADGRSVSRVVEISFSKNGGSEITAGLTIHRMEGDPFTGISSGPDGGSDALDLLRPGNETRYSFLGCITPNLHA